jgi:hypothetical protein
MKYGVVVCSKCKTPKGVVLSSKTTRCNRCNKNLIIQKVKVLYKTNSESELRNAIGFINAEKDGNLEKFKKTFAKQKT